MTALLLSPPSSPPCGTVSVPGSKSYTNRSLVIAALAPGLSRIVGASPSADSEALVAALQKLGVSVHSTLDRGLTTLIVEGRGGDFLPVTGEIDVGPAGTTMRFLTAVCAGVRGIDVVLKGSERMHQRPIGELVDALRSLGAEIDYLGKAGCPPLRIRSPRGLSGGTVSIDGSVSSQFLSALLLVGPLCSTPLTIEVRGDQASKSYIDMTLQSMDEFGVSVFNDGYRRYDCPKAPYAARQYRVEGDASGASYLWGLAALSNGDVTVSNINPLSAQGDIAFPSLLEMMGCSVTVLDRAIRVRGTRNLRPISTDMANMPDVAQTLAVVAACASGTSSLTGLATLRVKETDRIAALHTELAKVGVESNPSPASLEIHGLSISSAALHGARISTYDDHRMAMSFAMLGAIIPGMTIEHPRVVEKSFPQFWTTLSELGIASTEID